MALPTGGKLVKTTNLAYVQGVVGKRCVRYETPAPPPPAPGPPTPAPPNPKPPPYTQLGGGGSKCPPRELVTWTEKGVKYGQWVVTIPAGYGGMSVPPGCPTTSNVFRV